MTVEPKIVLRLQFLTRVVRKECQHLTTTDGACLPTRLPHTGSSARSRCRVAERVEAFVGRFGRLQDTVATTTALLLGALGEKTSAAIDNLDRANVWVCSSLLTNG